MILDKILAAKREEVGRRKAEYPVDRLVFPVGARRDFCAALKRLPGQPIRLIAEYKRASPSKGVIRADLTPADVARQYAEGGAAAMSVLTDQKFFSGTLDDLREVRAAVDLPLLRKDFIVDPYQLHEARAAGADAVLLIAAALGRAEIADFHAQAEGLGLSVLVEVHDENDLEKALSFGPKIVGVNNRDLQTFKVSIETTFRLRPLIPSGTVVVSESGIGSRDDAIRLEAAGVDAMLVGESLMRMLHPGRAAAELCGRHA